MNLRQLQEENIIPGDFPSTEDDDADDDGILLDPLPLPDRSSRDSFRWRDFRRECADMLEADWETEAELA